MCMCCICHHAFLETLDSQSGKYYCSAVLLIWLHVHCGSFSVSFVVILVQIISLGRSWSKERPWCAISVMPSCLCVCFFCCNKAMAGESGETGQSAPPPVVGVAGEFVSATPTPRTSVSETVSRQRLVPHCRVLSVRKGNLLWVGIPCTNVVHVGELKRITEQQW